MPGAVAVQSTGSVPVVPFRQGFVVIVTTACDPGVGFLVKRLPDYVDLF